MGLAIPEEYGGGGRGITDAAVMLHEIAASGAAMNGCSAVHLTVFGLNPVVRFGNDRLKETFLPRAAAGELHVAFGVTEPDAGTDTGRITTRAVPDGTGAGPGDAAAAASHDRRGARRLRGDGLQHGDRQVDRADQSSDQVGGAGAPVGGRALVLMTAPLAPHIAEEMWARLGHPESLAHGPFPEADPALLVAEQVEYPVQVKGKVRVGSLLMSRRRRPNSRRPHSPTPGSSSCWVGRHPGRWSSCPAR